MKASYIYIITNQINSVKIGFSVDPNKRVKQLQTGSSDKLELFWYTEISAPIHQIEKMIHKNLKHYKKVGEWFAIEPEIAKQEIEYAIITYSDDFTRQLVKQSILRL